VIDHVNSIDDSDVVPVVDECHRAAIDDNVSGAYVSLRRPSTTDDDETGPDLNDGGVDGPRLNDTSVDNLKVADEPSNSNLEAAVEESSPRSTNSHSEAPPVSPDDVCHAGESNNNTNSTDNTDNDNGNTMPTKRASRHPENWAGTAGEGFVAHAGHVTVQGAKVKLPSVYKKLGWPFSYSSFPGAEHFADLEMQQYIAKQRRCDYYNTLNAFTSLLIEVSSLLSQESDAKSLRKSLLRSWADVLNEWMFARRCIVAANEAIFHMTGLTIPVGALGKEPERAATAGHSPQMIRVVPEMCRPFPTKKRCPFLFVFEVADLDEDLFVQQDDATDTEISTVGKSRTVNCWDDLYVYGCIMKEVVQRELDVKSSPFDVLARTAAVGGVVRLTEQQLLELTAQGSDATDNPLEALRRALGLSALSTQSFARLESTELEESSTTPSKICEVLRDSATTKDELVDVNGTALGDAAKRRCQSECVSRFGMSNYVVDESSGFRLKRHFSFDDKNVKIKSNIIPTVEDSPPMPQRLVRVPSIEGSFHSADETTCSLPSMSLNFVNSEEERTTAAALTAVASREPPVGLLENINNTSTEDVALSSPEPSKIDPASTHNTPLCVDNTPPLCVDNTPSLCVDNTPSLAAANRPSLTVDSTCVDNSSAPASAVSARASSAGAASSTASVTHSLSAPSATSGPPSGSRTKKKWACDRFFALEASEVRRQLWGELWDESKERLRKTSPFGKLKSWNLRGVIIKGNDDLRQELLASQLVMQFNTIFQDAKLPLWLRPYEILVTGCNSGMMEYVADTQSVDALKKAVETESIADVYQIAFSDNPFQARKNFIESHAAYSIVTYVLQVKDRHNGNVLIDADGHVVHIDYGYMLSNSPGNVNFETSPFKLSQEYLDVMGGELSDNFEYFRNLVICGFLQARKHVDQILLLVEVMLSAAKMPCFAAAPENALQALKDRFMSNLAEDVCIQKLSDMLDQSVNNWRTVQYDNFQRITNGIL